MPVDLEITPSRDADVGGHEIRRALPTRERRTVGAWCFLDHMVRSTTAMAIGPHPHIGLQTVTWLVEGEVLHRDSLGTEQLIRPGQLNLMTAGRGVSHSEETPASYTGAMHGAQMWVAQPDATRHGEPAFEHHADLPVIDLPVEGTSGGGAATATATATVLVGELAGATSPARRDTDHVGAEIVLDPRSGGRGGPVVSGIPVDAAHEHAMVVLEGEVTIGDRRVAPGALAYLAPGLDELVLAAERPTRLMLLGGTPWDVRPTMWWNYVGRSHEEISAANDDWNAGHERFGTVASPVDRIPGPHPPWERSAS